MTTLEQVAVKQTAAKEHKGWRSIRSAITAAWALPLLLVGVLVDAAVLARSEEDSDGFH